MLHDTHTDSLTARHTHTRTADTGAHTCTYLSTVSLFYKSRIHIRKGCRNVAFDQRLYRQIWKSADSQFLLAGGSLRERLPPHRSIKRRGRLRYDDSAPQISRESLSLFSLSRSRSVCQDELNESTDNFDLQTARETRIFMRGGKKRARLTCTSRQRLGVKRKSAILVLPAIIPFARSSSLSFLPRTTDSTRLTTDRPTTRYFGTPTRLTQAALLSLLCRGARMRRLRAATSGTANESPHLPPGKIQISPQS